MLLTYEEICTASTCSSIHVQYLLLGQRSGLVPADILPLALQWTCYAARPAAARGSNIWGENDNVKLLSVQFNFQTRIVTLCATCCQEK